MNVFNKVALQGLRKNRSRTFVTIIGVALSTALITAVATFSVSLQNYMINGAIAKCGDWHIEFANVDSPFVQKQSANNNVESITSFENIGYAPLIGVKNLDKPYLFISGFHSETFATLPITLLSGRLPQNGEEILVPAHVSSNGGVKFSIKDSLTLPIGIRQTGNESLNQLDSYRSGTETLTHTMDKTYTVVGIYQRPTFEDDSAPGYTLITIADKTAAAKHFSTFVTLKKPGKIHSYIKALGNTPSYVLNDDVLRFMGLSDDKIFNTLLYSVGGIMIALVMLGSMFLIYNSFNISLNERTHQFGILMSVGATERQLRNSVLFEGICIGILGIPIGILIGIPSIKFVLSLVAKNFTNVLYDNVSLSLKVSIPPLVASAFISIITILISAYIPARKAAGTPVMECIRQTNEVKIEASKIKTSKFTESILGLEEALALKNFKRNKRRYRSIIFSLTLSVVLFVSTSAFVTNLKQVSEQTKVVTDYDIGFGTQDMDNNEMLALFNKLKTADGVTQGSYQVIIECLCTIQTDNLSDDYRKSTDNSLDETSSLTADIQFLDNEAYLQLINGLGLSQEDYMGENAKLITVAKMDSKAEEIQDLQNLFSTSSTNITLIPLQSGGLNIAQTQSINITCAEILPPDTPPDVKVHQKQPYFFRIIAPLSLQEKIAPSEIFTDVKVKGFTFQSDTPSLTTAEMQAMIDGSSITSNYTLSNIYSLLEQNRNILFIVNLFTIVFIAMISLISVANVFNTISTNIKLRRRELAMLRSVGMSDHAFSKMMRFECLLYGIWTLLFGLPISGIFSLLIYKEMLIGGASIKFVFPWNSIIISILGVFLVIFITMIYATNKIRKENIINALRDDMT